MKLNWNRRHVVLGAALTATLGAVAWAQQLETNKGRVAGPRTSTDRPAEFTAANEFSVEQLTTLRKENATGEVQANAFAPRSFYVPPPKRKAPPPPPPPAPKAPPLPFRYMGLLKESNAKTLVYLSRDDQLYAVRPGDVLEGTYRVEAISGQSVTFVYLPLNETQELRIQDPS